MPETKNIEKQEQEQESINPSKIVFKKPYVFEGKTYNEIDLSGLEDMTGEDLIRIEKALRMTGVKSLNFEMTPEGAFMYAAQAAGVPVEFFDLLPIAEARKIRVVVINFIWS